MKQNFGDIDFAKDGSDRVLVSSAIRYYFWFGFKYVHRYGQAGPDRGISTVTTIHRLNCAHLRDNPNFNPKTP